MTALGVEVDRVMIDLAKGAMADGIAASQIVEVLTTYAVAATQADAQRAAAR